MHCCLQLCCSCVCVCSFSPNLASLALSSFTSTVTCQKIWSLFHTPAINLIITCMFNFAHVPFHSSIHFLPLLVLHSTLWRGSSLPWLGGYWWGTIQHRFPVNARADRDEQRFMHIHTCGNFRVASSYICIFLGCGRKKKKTWDERETPQWKVQVGVKPTTLLMTVHLTVVLLHQVYIND